MVTARRDPAGMAVMTAKPYIVIPTALRHRCGLEPGDLVRPPACTRLTCSLRLSCRAGR